MKSVFMIAVALVLAVGFSTQSYAGQKKAAETAALMEKFLTATCEEAGQMSGHMYYKEVKKILGSDHVAVSRAYEYARLVAEVYERKKEESDSLGTLMMILREWKYSARPDCFTSRDGGWYSVEDMRKEAEEMRRIKALSEKADKLIEKGKTILGQ